MDDVAAEIKLAMRTLKHMPSDGPRDPGCAWPDVYHSPHEAYGWDSPKITRIPPLPEAVSRMDRCLAFFRRLTPDERVILSAGGDGAAWGLIMRMRRKKSSSKG